MDKSSFDLTPEQEGLRKIARELGLEFRSQAPEWTKKLPPYKEIIKRLIQAGIGSINLPVEYGGQGKTVLDYVLIEEELARWSQSMTPSTGLFATCGPGPSICIVSKNDAVRKKFLPAISKGEKLCCINMTEPKYGSAMTDLETSAVLDGDHYVLNGVKRFISGAGWFELYCTIVRFDGIPGAAGIGSIMVELDTPGLRFGKSQHFIGGADEGASDHPEVIMENCRVPKENLLTGPGEFKLMMGGFNLERMHNSTLALGIAEAAFDEAFKYAKERHQWGRPIWEFQAVYHKFAEMWTDIQAARYLIYKAAASSADGLRPPKLELSAAKLFANLMSVRVCQQCLWLMGGDGLTREFPMAQIFLESQLTPVAGGSPEILKNMIASGLFGQHIDQHRGAFMK